MSAEVSLLLQNLTIFVLAILVGSMFIAIEATDPAAQVLSFVAVAFATMNVVGGYVVTDRMLQMFKRKPASAAAAARSKPEA